MCTFRDFSESSRGLDSYDAASLDDSAFKQNYYSYKMKGAFVLANLDWIWTETGLVSDLPVAFTID